MDTITLQMHVPMTMYPTFTVRLADWRAAKEKLTTGQQPVLIGSGGGHGCRGGIIPADLDQVTLLAGPTEYGAYQAESENWGSVWLYE